MLSGISPIVWTIKEKYKLGSDIQSTILSFAFSLAGQIERQLISQRAKECLKRLKDEGKHLGHPFGFTYKKLHNRHQKIKELLDQQVPKSQIAKQLGCSWTHTRSTLPLRYMLQHIP